MADAEYDAANGAEEYQEQTEAIEDGGDENGASGDKINASKNDDDERKLFVGGLSWETTVKDLREYFEKFGDVVDCTLKTDPATGRSRGFGFVLFADVASVEKVFEKEEHLLHNRKIDPKRAKARGGREPIKKVFVGGLDPEVPEADIRDYFGKFGKIEELDLPFDKVKNQRRAFCFITFESEEVADKATADARQTIGGKEVDVKKATPKNEQYGPFGRGGRGGFRGRGRGRGYNSGYGNYYDGYGGYQGYGPGYGGYNNYDYNYYDYNYYGPGWGNQGYGNNYGNYGGRRGGGNYRK